MRINIACDYTDTPGGRYISQGPFSGEDFRNKLLIPALKNAISNKKKLEIDFDGVYGYGVSFLEESFGGLIREGFKYSDIKKCIIFISNEDDTIIPKIEKYLKEANDRL